MISMEKNVDAAESIWKIGIGGDALRDTIDREKMT
jgi:hypothetical protein